MKVRKTNFINSLFFLLFYIVRIDKDEKSLGGQAPYRGDLRKSLRHKEYLFRSRAVEKIHSLVFGSLDSGIGYIRRQTRGRPVPKEASLKTYIDRSWKWPWIDRGNPNSPGEIYQREMKESTWVFDPNRQRGGARVRPSLLL